MAPRLGLRSKPLSRGCDEKQHRLHALHESEPAQSNWVHPWGTQQLCGSTQVNGVIRMVPQAKRHSKFLVRQHRLVRRKVLRKIPLVVNGATFDCAFEEPLAYSLLFAVAQLAHLAQ